MDKKGILNLEVDPLRPKEIPIPRCETCEHFKSEMVDNDAGYTKGVVDSCALELETSEGKMFQNLLNTKPVTGKSYGCLFHSWLVHDNEEYIATFNSEGLKSTLSHPYWGSTDFGDSSSTITSGIKEVVNDVLHSGIQRIFKPNPDPYSQSYNSYDQNSFENPSNASIESALSSMKNAVSNHMAGAFTHLISNLVQVMDARISRYVLITLEAFKEDLQEMIIEEIKDRLKDRDLKFRRKEGTSE